MKTLRQMRTEALIAEYDKQLELLLERVSMVKDCVIHGQIKPNAAIKRYHEIMRRAVIINKRTWILTNKEEDFKRKYDITHFNEYVEFFEM